MKKIVVSNQATSEFDHLMNMYGFHKCGVNKYEQEFKDDTIKGQCILIIHIKSSKFTVFKLNETSSGLRSKKERNFDNVLDLISYLDIIWEQYMKDDIFSSSYMFESSKRQSIVAAINTRNLTKNLVRVRSSNVWAYAINIRDRKDKTGDVIAQFKGKNGGPGDIYIYYDVPVNLYRRWVGAPSKGHFFWQYIRNNFQYSKLTGNKRGVLKNAVNRR